MLTNENINKLMELRKVVDDYHFKVNRYGNITSINNDLKSKIEKIDVDNNYHVFNRGMCILEIDRCYETRLKEEYSGEGKYPLCDGCKGRIDIWCKSLLCDVSTPNMMQLYSPFLKYEDSIVIKKQLKAIKESGFTPLTIATPLCRLMFAEIKPYISPTICNLQTYQIEEPRFDLDWGNQDIVKIGKMLEDSTMALWRSKGGI